LFVGQCIYCGATTGPFTREHVIPRGLGGDWEPEGHGNALVLQKASCPSCQNVTQKIEEHCLRSMMNPARARLGLKRKDRGSGNMRGRLEKADGSVEERDVPIDELPAALVIPSFYEAGALSGKPIVDSAPCDYKFVIVAPARGKLNEGDRLGVAMSANAKTFARMLGKIALGVAVAGLGVGGFRPLVRDLILNKPEEAGHWVGGFAGLPSDPARSTSFHKVRLTGAQALAGEFVIVEIALFAEFGGPTNYVVVGQPL
jgi:hypothetical protein